MVDFFSAFVTASSFPTTTTIDGKFPKGIFFLSISFYALHILVLATTISPHFRHGREETQWRWAWDKQGGLETH